MARRETVNKRRARRVRHRLRGSAGGRPRLSVYRSNKHIYAQVIDDVRGVTLASASTLDRDVRAAGGSGGSVAAATKVGEVIAGRAKLAGTCRIRSWRISLSRPGQGACRCGARGRPFVLAGKAHHGSNVWRPRR